MKKLRKCMVALLTLAIAMGLCYCPLNNVKAAKSKAYLEQKSLVLSIGKQSYSSIYVYNQVKGAKYTYKSSNTKVVTVDKKGIITGLKAGKANITVSQNLKGKVTKVGTVKVEIKASKLIQKKVTINYSNMTGTQENYLENIAYWDLIDYYSSSATYTYYSSDSKKLTITKKGAVTKVGNPGDKVTVTIKETYKKKTRTVGKLEVTIAKPEITESSIEVGYKRYFTPGDYLKGFTGDYYLISSDQKDPITNPADVKEGNPGENDSDAVIDFAYEDGTWYGTMIANKEGTAYVHYYATDKAAGVSEKTYIGTLTVNVKKYPATKLEWSSYFEENTKDNMITYNYEEGYDTEYYMDYQVEPSETCTDEAIVTSSNEKVAKVIDNSYLGELELEILGEGETTITVQVGNLKIEKKIKFVKYVD